MHREAKQGLIQNNHMYPQLSSNEALSYYNLLYANSAKLNSRETHHTLCLMEKAYINRQYLLPDQMTFIYIIKHGQIEIGYIL